MDERGAVIDTVNRYATALDTRVWPILDDIFAEDAVADFGQGELHGRAPIRRMIARMLGDCGPTQHLLANHVVDLDGDRARCVCQVRAFHASAEACDDRRYELIGEYRDRLTRTPAGWRITHRELAIRHEIGSREVLGIRRGAPGARRR